MQGLRALFNTNLITAGASLCRTVDTPPQADRCLQEDVTDFEGAYNQPVFRDLHRRRSTEYLLAVIENFYIAIQKLFIKAL